MIQYATIYGIIFMLLNTVSLAFIDLSSATLTSTGLTSTVVAFMYKFSSFVIILPWVLKDGIKVLKTDKVHIHLFRSLFSVAGSICFIEGLKNGVPLADAAIFENFQYIMLIVISMIFFGDRVTLPKVFAIMLGFVGAITTVYAQIGLEAVDPYSYLYTFLAICFWSLNSVSVKILGYTEKNKTQMFYLLLFAVMWIIIKFCCDGINWLAVLNHEFDWSIWAQNKHSVISNIALTKELILIVLFMALCYFIHGVCYFQALKFDFSLVVPFRYTKLVFSAFLGYIFLAQVPTMNSYIGYALIITSSVILYMHEKNKNKKLQVLKEKIDEVSSSPSEELVDQKVQVKSEA